MNKLSNLLLLPLLAFPLSGCAEDTQETVLDVGLGYEIVLEGVPLAEIESYECPRPMEMTMRAETMDVLKALDSRRGPRALLLRPAAHMMKICGRRSANSHSFQLNVKVDDEKLGTVSFRADYSQVKNVSVDISTTTSADEDSYLTAFYKNFPSAKTDLGPLREKSDDGAADHSYALALSLDHPAGFKQAVIANDPASVVGVKVDQEMLELAIDQGHPIAATIPARIVFDGLRGYWKENINELPDQDRLTLLFGAAQGELRGSYGGYRLGGALREQNLPVDAAVEKLAELGTGARPADLITVLSAVPVLTDVAIHEALNRALYVDGCRDGMMSRYAEEENEVVGYLAQKAYSYVPTEDGCNVNFGMDTISFNVIPKIDANCDGGEGRYVCTVSYKDNCHAFTRAPEGPMRAIGQVAARLTNEGYCQVVSSYNRKASFSLEWSKANWDLSGFLLEK